MYLLDTNVISELRKIRSGKADLKVTQWVNSVSPDSLYLSVIVIRELRYGALLIARRDQEQGKLLNTWINESVLVAFEQHILPITTEISLRCAELHIPNPRPEMDTFIAATALVHNLTLVTRNLGDFEGTGVSLLNPWDYS